MRTLRAGDRILSTSRPLVMGILNLSSDSFFDGGRYANPESALAQCRAMIDEGASIIDIGANSSRPGSEPVGPVKEWHLLEPVLRSIREEIPSAILSVDTFHSDVAEKALNLGVQMINDISAGTDDGRMTELLASTGATYIAMHKKGSTRDMQVNPEYENVVEELSRWFVERLKEFERSGIRNLVLDPGFGFGKSLQHNYILLRELRAFKEIFQLPVLVGISRKSMINRVIGTVPEQALNGTTALHTLALVNGADILRVHDVKQAVECVQLYSFYQAAGKMPDEKPEL